MSLLLGYIVLLACAFGLAAGLFFGIIGPVTKTAYNLGAGVGLAIFLRYIVALLIVAPLIPYQKNLPYLFYIPNSCSKKWTKCLWFNKWFIGSKWWS